MHLMLGNALFAAGRLPEARVSLERARELGSTQQFRALLACVLAAMGDMEEARGLLAEAEELARAGEGSAVEVASAYHWLGSDELAYEWLERGFQARDLWMSWLHLDPRFRRLHGEARFESLIQRVGTAPPRV
jgi:tetratricopeptide (TPR) repeat protein